MSWAESIECPRCGASPWQPCVTDRGEVAAYLHRARIVSSVVGVKSARAVAVVDDILKASEARGNNEPTFTSVKGQ